MAAKPEAPKARRGHVFRYVSQYVAAGAKRVATSGSSPDALACKNPDGSIVVAMHNSDSAAKTTTLAVGTTKPQFSIPANGFATVRKQRARRFLERDPSTADGLSQGGTPPISSFAEPGSVVSGCALATSGR